MERKSKPEVGIEENGKIIYGIGYDLSIPEEKLRFENDISEEYRRRNINRKIFNGLLLFNCCSI